MLSAEFFVKGGWLQRNIYANFILFFYFIKRVAIADYIYIYIYIVCSTASVV
jgi:hypothetical protein